MFRLSLIINEVYNKYLPLAEKGGVSLNLDFRDSTQTIDEPKALQADLEKHLDSVIKNSDRGDIKITVQKDAIIISDSQTVLSKTLCSLLSSDHITVKSRIGFGTTITILFNHSNSSAKSQPLADR